MQRLRVYIDEAGDEGFKIPAEFKGGLGSSRWFIAAAVVVTAEEDRDTASAVNAIKNTLWPDVPQHTKPLHWRDLKHKQKKVVLAELKPKQFTWLGICLEKELLQRDRFDSRIVRKTKPEMKTPLYNYTVRLLFERVTRLASSTGRTIDVVFENRASLSIPEVSDYLKMLETLPGPYGPPTIPPGLVSSVTTKGKDASKMLQIADVCAGALNNALEPDIYGQVEPEYLLTLGPKLNRVKGLLWGYGLKLFPERFEDCVKRQPAYEWMGKL